MFLHPNDHRMMKENDPLEQIFASSFERFELEPSEDLWARVESRIGGPVVKPGLPWGRRAIIAVVAAGVAGAAAWGLGNWPEPNPPLAVVAVMQDSGSPGHQASAELAASGFPAQHSLAAQPSVAAPSAPVAAPPASPWVEPARPEMPQGAAPLVAAQTESLGGQAEIQEAAHPDWRVRWVASTTEGCTPLYMDALCHAERGDLVVWSFSDGSSITGPECRRTLTGPGDQQVLLSITRGGQTKVERIDFQIHERPHAQAVVDANGQALSEHPVFFRDYSSGATRWEWSFGDGAASHEREPMHQYARQDFFDARLVVGNDFGCTDTAHLVDVLGLRQRGRLEFPNAFTPSLTGPRGGAYSQDNPTNRVFHPIHSGVREYEMRIFNRAGQLVFQTSDVNEGWDGYFQGQLMPQGVYIWHVVAKFDNGLGFEKIGDITLLHFR